MFSVEMTKKIHWADIQSLFLVGRIFVGAAAAIVYCTAKAAECSLPTAVVRGTCSLPNWILQPSAAKTAKEVDSRK